MKVENVNEEILEIDGDGTVHETADSWKVRESVERLLHDEYHDMLTRTGCETSNNYDAAMNMMRIIKILKSVQA